MIINYNFEDINSGKLVIIRVETENLLYTFDFSLYTKEDTVSFLEFVKMINYGSDKKLIIENEDEIITFTHKSGALHIQINENSFLYIKDSSIAIQTFNDICNDIYNNTI
jgi:hypothetical protein